jgi:hypothetical protein
MQVRRRLLNPAKRKRLDRPSRCDSRQARSNPRENTSTPQGKAELLGKTTERPDLFIPLSLSPSPVPWSPTACFQANRSRRASALACGPQRRPDAHIAALDLARRRVCFEQDTVRDLECPDRRMPSLVSLVAERQQAGLARYHETKVTKCAQAGRDAGGLPRRSDAPIMDSIQQERGYAK